MYNKGSFLDVAQYFSILTFILVMQQLRIVTYYPNIIGIPTWNFFGKNNSETVSKSALRH